MRINRAIALLERGDALYYSSPHELSYASGKQHAQTWADFLLVEFEHAPFDPVGLAAFMRGMVDGGPTADGFRTPTVLATLPANARTASEVHANAWQCRQVLACGVHGIVHTHVRAADAARAFVESCRYPFQLIGVGAGLDEGQRGSGGQEHAANIWGVTVGEYLRLADPWPLNPEGELLLGVKLEDRHAVEHADAIARTPGLAFAEWGPGDMGMSYGFPENHDPPYPAQMEAARHVIKNACDAAGLAFLSSWNDASQSVEENVTFLLDWGARILSGGEQIAITGRRIERERRATR